MEFTTTEKGNRKLIHEGYMYVFQKNLANDVTSREWGKGRGGEYKTKIKLDEVGNFLERIKDDTHVPSEAKCEIAKVRANIKRRATETQNPAQVILRRELGGISEAAAINLPALHHIRRNIRLQKQSNQQLPSPANREDVPELPLQYQRSYANEQFLIFDSGQGDADRIFIFGTNQSLQLLSQSQNWFGDGTFKVCPQIFFQIYTIHAQINGRILPCIYALLPNKTEETYTRLFREVEQHVANSPTDILMDFERAALNSVGQVYPNTEFKGCFYHFSSNIWKHIQNLGLQNHYQDDENFALWLRMLSALAFVPPNDVIRYFELLIDEIRNNFNDECDDLMDYFEDTYIGFVLLNL